jgi:hypothetical protein
VNYIIEDTKIIQKNSHEITQIVFEFKINHTLKGRWYILESGGHDHPYKRALIMMKVISWLK